MTIRPADRSTRRIWSELSRYVPIGRVDVGLQRIRQIHVGFRSVIDKIPAKKWDHSNGCPVAATDLVNILSRFDVKGCTATPSIVNSCTTLNTPVVLGTRARSITNPAGHCVYSNRLFPSSYKLRRHSSSWEHCTASLLAVLQDCNQDVAGEREVRGA